MNTLTNKNAQTINNAFTAFKAMADKSGRIGIEKLLQWGLERCLQKHDSRHQSHIEMGGGYGWILFHNGIEVKRYVYTAHGNIVLDINEAMSEIKLKHWTWEGYVVACMKPRSWFVRRAEISFMNGAIADMSELDFQEVFKPVD